MTSNDNTTNTNIRSDGASNDSVLKRKSEDIGWEYGKLINPSNFDKEIRREVNLAGIEEEEEEVEGLGIRKRSHFLGPLDKFATKITPEASMSASKSIRQQHINDVLFKERTHSVHRYVARWVYEAGVPFNAIQNHSFTAMMEAAGLFGPGYKQPSRYQLSGPLLKEEFDSTKDALKKQEQEWKLTGCSIMTDAWTDRKRRSIMNLCVNCKEGTTFLSSKESSNEAHTGEHIFDYVLKCIEQVGPQNVVQVVTDNAANNMAAAKMLREKMPTIFWSSCATHTINLMLEALESLIFNRPKFVPGIKTSYFIHRARCSNFPIKISSKINHYPRVFGSGLSKNNTFEAVTRSKPLNRANEELGCEENQVLSPNLENVKVLLKRGVVLGALDAWPKLSPVLRLFKEQGLILAALLGVVNIGATALVTEAATTIFGEAGVSAATGVMTVAILLLTEFTPKSIVVHNATEVARFVVRPVAWLSLVLYPVGRVVTYLSLGMLKALGLKGRSELYVTEDELKLMLRGAELSGAIEEEEQDMIENVLEIKDTHVREVMTPLVDVVAIDAGASLVDFHNLWVTHQYSRVPVFEQRVDNIVGIAYPMDMLDYVPKGELQESTSVGDHMAHKPAYSMPGNPQYQFWVVALFWNDLQLMIAFYASS
ncbi:hypothetical protein EZV62_008925 [Acer yangbiense]|uniref:DUF659 domain-containing protein n=1 Tax=Acer yangbiense TaxID=1000413 RepID=A0A5C7IEB3_9ROSI|nr:hypothetical protein EZV62_008925 [Acer yangbiense]